MTPKRAIGMPLFELVYGMNQSLPLPLELATSNLQREVEDQVSQNSVERRITYLTKIEEHLFDKYDRCVKNKVEGDLNNAGQYDSINIGSSGNPKLGCVGKFCSAYESLTYQV